jgi:hypothetical protein
MLTPKIKAAMDQFLKEHPQAEELKVVAAVRFKVEANHKPVGG